MSGFKCKLVLDTFNFVEVGKYCNNLESDLPDPDSPVAFKKNLGIDELDKQLFPLLVTGVKWWPFLTLAITCKTESDRNKIFRISKALSKEMKAKRGIGPQASATLRSYLSMADNIQNSDDGKRLKEFLTARAFDGSASFFSAYNREERWREAFISANGQPANAYIEAYKKSRKSLGNESSVWDVVTEILSRESNTYNELLWHGAFVYAMVRCLYGYYDRSSGKVKGHDSLVDWRKLLLDICGDPPKCLPKHACSVRYIHLLKQIDEANPKPPLANQTKKFRENGRPVLSSLRISLFHDLYYRPRPARLQ